MKKTTIILCLVALFFGAAAAYAAGEGYSTAQYAEAAKTDTATKMLGFLFGDVKGYFEGTNTHIAKMFLVFNTAVASVAVLLLLINIMSATVQTAHEGEVLGRRYSTIWMPIRNVWGLACAFPVLGGWSISQAIMFLAALVGIGIGTLTWKAAISGVLETVTRPTLTASAVLKDETMMALLQAQMCQIGYNAELDRGGDVTAAIERLGRKSGVATKGDGPWLNWEGAYIVYGGSGGGNGMPLDYCGGVRIPFPLTPPVTEGYEAAQGVAMNFQAPRASGSGAPFNAAAVFQAKQRALIALDAKLAVIAKRFYEDNNQRPTYEELRRIRDQYKDDVARSLAAESLSKSNSFGEFLSGDGQSFIWAGAIFNKIAAVQRQIMDAADESLEPVGPRAKSWTFPIGGVDGNVQGALAKAETFQQQIKADFSTTSPDVMAFFSDSMQSPVLAGALNLLTMGEVDLMSGLTKLGYVITGVVLGVLAKAASIIGAVGVVSTIVNVTSLLNFLGNIVLLTCIPLLLAGLVFAFYVPFIPMMSWFSGVLSWFITVCEAVIAAPLWTIAHMEAEGEGMGEKTAHGYMFLFNLFFRPALMVIGLVLGWLIVNVFGVILKYTLSIFYGSGYGTTNVVWHTLTGLFMFIACMIVFASLAMYTVNKAFSLIHVVPDQVFAWVGGHFKGFGGDEGRDAHHDFVGVARGGAGKGEEYVGGKRAEATEKARRAEGNPMLDTLKSIERELRGGGGGKGGGLK